MKYLCIILYLLKSNPEAGDLKIPIIALVISILALLITAIFYLLNYKLNYKNHLINKENINNLIKLEELKLQPVLNLHIKDSICYLMNSSNAVAKEIIVNFQYEATSYQPIHRLFIENFDIKGVDGNPIYKVNLMAGDQIQLFTYDNKLKDEILKALTQIKIQITYKDITGKPYEISNALIFS